MRARELMTTEVASVPPEATPKEIARLLLSRGISAVPVVDRSGSPIGMVSEGDLIGRGEPERKQRRDWWLAMLAEGEQLSEEYVASLGGKETTARDLMSAPLITVEENSEAADILGLSAPAAGMRHLRALRRLREVLGEASQDASGQLAD